MECVFCRIVSGEVPTEFIWEDEHVVAFADIHPKAPVHLLIIPREHRANLAVLTAEERSSLFTAAAALAKKYDVSESGFRLAMNIGSDSGQEVEHLHLHLLGGKPARGLY